MAPLLVADLSALATYSEQLADYHADGDRQGETASARLNDKDTPPDDALPSGLELAVAIRACEEVESRVRALCCPPPEDIVLWREELEQAAEADAVRISQPPDGTVLADIAA